MSAVPFGFNIYLGGGALCLNCNFCFCAECPAMFRFFLFSAVLCRVSFVHASLKWESEILVDGLEILSLAFTDSRFSILFNVHYF